MIRKILIFLIFAFIALWLSGAHLIKNKIILILQESQSDNIKIVYSDIKVSGFPLSWRVKILDPKVSLTTQLQTNEFSSKHLLFIFNYRLTGVSLCFDQSILLNETKDTKIQTYDLESLENPLSINLKYAKPILLMDNSEIFNLLKSIKISDFDFAVSQKEERIFTISNASLHFNKTNAKKLENINFKLNGGYKSENSPFKFNNANISLDFDYVKNIEINIEPETNINFDRLIKVNKGELTLDESALNLKGNIQLSRSKLPEGEIWVSMNKYPELTDILVPDGFIVSNLYLKRLISKVVNAADEHEVAGNAKFKIKFGIDGTFIGNINLLELRN